MALPLSLSLPRGGVCVVAFVCDRSTLEKKKSKAKSKQKQNNITIITVIKTHQNLHPKPSPKEPAKKNPPNPPPHKFNKSMFFCGELYREHRFLKPGSKTMFFDDLQMPWNLFCERRNKKCAFTFWHAERSSTGRSETCAFSAERQKRPLLRMHKSHCVW